jgi:hypothetical protein
LIESLNKENRYIAMFNLRGSPLKLRKGKYWATIAFVVVVGLLWACTKGQARLFPTQCCSSNRTIDTLQAA